MEPENARILASAIGWAAVITATALVSAGADVRTQLLLLVGGGAAASVVVVGGGIPRRQADR